MLKSGKRQAQQILENPDQKRIKLEAIEMNDIKKEAINVDKDAPGTANIPFLSPKLENELKYDIPALLEIIKREEKLFYHNKHLAQAKPKSKKSVSFASVLESTKKSTYEYSRCIFPKLLVKYPVRNSSPWQLQDHEYAASYDDRTESIGSNFSFKAFNQNVFSSKKTRRRPVFETLRRICQTRRFFPRYRRPWVNKLSNRIGRKMMLRQILDYESVDKLC